MHSSNTSTIGQRAADFASAKIGSWAFLITFNALMLCWIGLNLFMGDKAFDVFPFVFLNLMLSWLAGVQAPLIMISQNRQEEIQAKTVSDIEAIARATYEIALAMRDKLIEEDKRV